MPQLCSIGNLMGGSGAGGFSPAAVGDLVAWYDFSDSAALTLASTAITQALDLSGRGNHTAVQGTGTSRPAFAANQQNGLAMATFDGGDQLLFPQAVLDVAAGNNTIFAVANRTSEDGSNDGIFSVGTGTTNYLMIFYPGTAGQVQYRSRVFGAGGVISTGNTNTNVNIITGRREGTTQAVSVNGGAEVTDANGGDAPTKDAGQLGNTLNGLFLTGRLGELFFYNRSLASAEMIAVRAYLSTKWGVTLS